MGITNKNNLKSSSQKIEYNKVYYLENREKYKEKRKIYYLNNKQRWEKQSLKRRYGISYEELEKLLESQNFKCLICFRDLNLAEGIKGQDKPVVDHCHITNKIRGILCSSCNVGLGNFKDSIIFLENAIKYLQEQK